MREGGKGSGLKLSPNHQIKSFSCEAYILPSNTNTALDGRQREREKIGKMQKEKEKVTH